MRDVQEGERKMKKHLLLAAVLTLVLLFGGLMITVSQTQGPQTGAPPSLPPSSAPVLEGEQSASPPDQPHRVDPLDADAQVTYNAYLRVAGSALKPRESNVEWSGAGGGGCIFASAGSIWAVFNTPIYLAQGSTVKYIRMYYDDTNVNLNSCAWFTVYNRYGSIVQENGVCSTGSAGNGYSTSTEFTRTIDYSLYSYVINWRPYDLGSDTQVCGFRIYYHTAPGETYLPVILNSH